MKQFKITIKTNQNKYKVVIGKNLINNFLKILNNNSINFNKCLLVIDNKVPNEFIKKINFALKKKKIFKYFFNPNEKNKNQKTSDLIIKILLYQIN